MHKIMKSKGGGDVFKYTTAVALKNFVLTKCTFIYINTQKKRAHVTQDRANASS